MSSPLSPEQQQKLRALVDADAQGFATEASARDMAELDWDDRGSTSGGSATEAPASLEIHLGHICNNICSFCVSGQLTQQRLARPLPEGPLKQAMALAREKGTRQVVFLGGEPTIQSNFFPALEHAVELGFEDIIIFSNLVRGRDEKFLERVCAYPGVRFRVSIQGGDRDTHDRVVKRAGAFDKIDQGIGWLCARGIRVSVNSCVTAESVGSLEGHAALLDAHPIEQLHLDMFRPSSAGRRAEEYALDLIPDYNDVAEHLRRCIEAMGSRRDSLSFSVGGLPYCFLPAHADVIHHGGEKTFILSPGDAKGWDKYSAQDEGRVQTKDCERCVFQSRCHGVPIGYGIKFPNFQLRPVGLHALFSLSGEVRTRLGVQTLHTLELATCSPPVRRLLRRLATVLRLPRTDGWYPAQHMVLSDPSRAAVRFLRPDAGRRSGEQPSFSLCLSHGDTSSVWFEGDTDAPGARAAIAAAVRGLSRASRPRPTAERRG